MNTNQTEITSTDGHRGRMLMIQGTTSHAGKSVITAGLCRIFARQGWRVAPYKSQNMALNSYVTPDGAEIGRAQAYQAAAAGIEPSADMNPILLKPNSEFGSQVIVLGKVVANMQVRQYHEYQKEVWPIAAAALDRLRQEYDLVIAEGAGSPAEINLYDRDLANMRVARHANCPVVLVADIDRGGVFASLVGTIELIPPSDRALIRGIIINKFRGDASLLDSGIRFLTERTGIPTLGVVPMLKNWQGDEEDSLGLVTNKFLSNNTSEDPLSKQNSVNIAVIRLPSISNYTDFDSLAQESDVQLRFIDSTNLLTDGTCTDVIILPGSKNTMADLAWLRQSGFATTIDAMVKENVVHIFGICGGFQMLGHTLSDPQEQESATTSMTGLGLLNLNTVFHSKKLVRRVEGEIISPELAPVGTRVKGYEIHLGRSVRGPGTQPLLRLAIPTKRAGNNALGINELTDEDKTFEMDGGISREGLIAGTYLHGIFDEQPFRRAWLNIIRNKKGLPPLATTAEDSNNNSRRLTIDDLANHLEKHLDMDAIRSCLSIYFYSET